MTDLGLRERQKQKRRAEFLAAARALFRERDGDAVSAEQIAARAELSTQSLYNLVGTREDLVTALLNEVLDMLPGAFDASAKADPIACGRALIVRCVELFTADPAVMRYVVRRISGCTEANLLSVSRQPFVLQLAAMSAAQEQGLLSARLTAVQIVYQIILSFQGALTHWASGLADAEQFLDQALHGYWTVIAAASSDPDTTANARREMIAAAREMRPMVLPGPPAS